MESVKLSITEETFTDLDDLSARIQSGVTSTWNNPGSGQEDITIALGYNWKVSDGTVERTLVMKRTLLETSPTVLNTMIANILTAEKAMLALSSFGTFVSAYGYAVITVQYNN